MSHRKLTKDTGKKERPCASSHSDGFYLEGRPKIVLVRRTRGWNLRKIQLLESKGRNPKKVRKKELQTVWINPNHVSADAGTT